MYHITIVADTSKYHLHQHYFERVLNHFNESAEKHITVLQQTNFNSLRARFQQ